MKKEFHLDSSGRESTGSGKANQTKLSIVLAELKTNPDVFFAGHIIRDVEDGTVQPRYGHWSETFSIIVSPTAPIFDIPDLNRFMHGLIKGVKSSCYDDAYPKDEHGGIHFGRLYYDEPVARIQSTIQRLITTSDQEAAARLNMVLGNSEEYEDEEVWRRTWLNVYPDPITAAVMSGSYPELLREINRSGKFLSFTEYWIEGPWVQKLKDYYGKNSNPMSKIAGFLKRPGQ